jgi:hypothetical protein
MDPVKLVGIVFHYNYQHRTPDSIIIIVQSGLFAFVVKKL